jgi:hypothetical protein
MKSCALAGSGGKRSRHCFSSKELAMKEGSLQMRGCSWLSTHCRRACMRLPLTETMGQVFIGCLWILKVR